MEENKSQLWVATFVIEYPEPVDSDKVNEDLAGRLAKTEGFKYIPHSITEAETAVVFETNDGTPTVLRFNKTEG